MAITRGYARHPKRIYAVEKCGFPYLFLLWGMDFARISYKYSLPCCLKTNGMVLLYMVLNFGFTHRKLFGFFQVLLWHGFYYGFFIDGPNYSPMQNGL